MTLDIFTLYSDCVNGKKAKVKVRAWGPAVGFGVAVSSGGGKVEFEDGLSVLSPEIFNGGYKKTSYGLSWGIGLGGGVIQLGGAYSSLKGLIPSMIGGVDASVMGSAGFAEVVGSVIMDCGCGS